MSGHRVTLMVTNGTCQTGACVPVEIRGLVPKFMVPGQPPAGFLRIGRVEGKTACLLIPPEMTLTIRGGSDTTKIIWTTADELILTASDGTPWSLLGRSVEFVPAHAEGWSITLPGVGDELPPPNAATACTP